MPEILVDGPVRREGLTVLQESQDDLVDLVFVHGLNGDSWATWTSKSRLGQDFCWIAQLPESLRRVRAMTFGYQANFYGGSDNLMGIRDHAQTFLLHLRNKRRGTSSRRPVVFLCHSLGGLLVKQALISSARKKNYEAIHQSTVAIFFFGTPHRGSRILESNKKVAMIENIAKVANYEIPMNLRSALEPGSRELFAINDDFSDVKRDITIVNFYETKKSDKINALVVEQDSAIMHHPGEDNIALMRTHQDLVRYRNRDDDTFMLVVETIAEKLSEILENPVDYDAEDMKSFRSSFIQRLDFRESEHRMVEIPIPHQRTFDWLWDEGIQLSEWKRKSRGLFWVTGKPGSGKSTLAKEIFQQLLDDCPKDTVIISFFFKSGGTILQKSARGMLRSFLFQLLQHAPNVQSNAFFTIRRKGAFSMKEQGDWSTTELQRMLVSLLNTWKTSINLVIIVDAIDECHDMGESEMLDLFHQLISPQISIGVKIWFSSRKIRAVLNHPGLRLEDVTARDISIYVDDSLGPFATAGEVESLEALKASILQRSNGIFLWVHLLIKRLKNDFEDGNSLSDYKTLLSLIPSELTELYEDILMKIPQHYHEERNRFLGLVLCAHRPMSLTEFGLAMALGGEKLFASHAEMERSSAIKEKKLMTRRISSRCGGLIEVKDVNDGGSVVQFIHQSVNDFLEDRTNPELQSRGSLTQVPAIGHVALSRACIRYCILPELKSLLLHLRSQANSGMEDDRAATERRYPFLDYAVQYWMAHCEEAEDLGEPQTKELIRFETAGIDTFETWLELHNRHSSTWRPFADDTTLFLVAVMCGCKDYVVKKLEAGVSTETPVKYFGHFLHIAAMSRKPEIVKILLQYGAEVNAVGGHFHTALQAAAFSGCVESATILLNAGANLYLNGGDSHSAIYAAAYYGNMNVLDLFLRSDTDIALKTSSINSALTGATSAGRHTVVQKLLSYGADVDRHSYGGVNCLFWAVYSRSEDTVKVLVEGGVDVDANLFVPGLTILHWLSLHGTEDSVRLVLSKGADVEVCDHDGCTPLHWAVSNSREGVLGALLEIQSDCNATNNYGMTPLHYACAQAGFNQLQILIDNGADVHARDILGFSVLHYAALNPSPEILISLLHARSDLELDVMDRDVFGRKPLHIAAEFGCLNGVKVVARAMDDIEEADEDGRTILHAGARNDSIDVLSYCLTRVTRSTVDNAGMSPLHHIFQKPGRLPRLSHLPSLLEELRKLRRQQEKRDSERKKKPKHRKHAADDWEEVRIGMTQPGRKSTIKAKIKMLVDFGVDVNAQDDNGNTVLHLACWQGEVGTIELLLELGARCDLRDSRGFVPYDVASSEEARDLLEKVHEGHKSLCEGQYIEG